MTEKDVGQKEMEKEKHEFVSSELLKMFREEKNRIERIDVAYKLKAFMKKEAINEAYFTVLDNNIMEGIKTDNDLRNLQKTWENELLKEQRAMEYYEYNKGNVKSLACGTNMTDDEIRSAIRYAYFSFFIETFLDELEKMYCALNNRPFPLPIDYDERAKRQQIIDEKVKNNAKDFFGF